MFNKNANFHLGEKLSPPKETTKVPGVGSYEPI